RVPAKSSGGSSPTDPPLRIRWSHEARRPVPVRVGPAEGRSPGDDRPTARIKAGVARGDVARRARTGGRDPLLRMRNTEEGTPGVSLEKLVHDPANHGG